MISFEHARRVLPKSHDSGHGTGRPKVGRCWSRHEPYSCMNSRSVLIGMPLADDWGRHSSLDSLWLMPAADRAPASHFCSEQLPAVRHARLRHRR